MIKDLKEFSELLKICRKQGVSSITVGGVSVSFGEMPKKRRDEEEDTADIPTEGLTPEQMMFYSAGGNQ